MVDALAEEAGSASGRLTKKVNDDRSAAQGNRDPSRRGYARKGSGQHAYTATESGGLSGTLFGLMMTMARSATESPAVIEFERQRHSLGLANLMLAATRFDGLDCACGLVTLAQFSCGQRTCGNGNARSSDGRCGTGA